MTAGVSIPRADGRPWRSAPVAAAVIGTAVAVQVVDFRVYALKVGFLDSADEWSYSHVLASAALVCGTIACALAVTAGGRRRAAWWIACGLFACLAVDNLTRLHEQIAFWPVIYAPALATLMIALAMIGRDTDRAGVIYAGLGLLAASFGIHVLGPSVVTALGWTQDSLAYQVKVALKEGTELAGWVLLIPAVARLARRRLGRRGAL